MVRMALIIGIFALQLFLGILIIHKTKFKNKKNILYYLVAITCPLYFDKLNSFLKIENNVVLLITCALIIFFISFILLFILIKLNKKKAHNKV